MGDMIGGDKPFPFITIVGTRLTLLDTRGDCSVGFGAMPFVRGADMRSVAPFNSRGSFPVESNGDSTLLTDEVLMGTLFVTTGEFPLDALGVAVFPWPRFSSFSGTFLGAEDVCSIGRVFDSMPFWNGCLR